jgi:hypothetical protein
MIIQFRTAQKANMLLLHETAGGNKRLARSFTMTKTFRKFHKDLVDELRVITVDACNICAVTKFTLCFLSTVH